MTTGNLWKTTDISHWQKYLSAYETTLKFVSDKKKKRKLISLDKWYKKKLGKNIRKRNIPYIEKSELVKLMEWKLTRGKFRPRLTELIQANTDEDIKKISEASFRDIDQPDVAIKELCKLRGVGPATASAILTSFNPEQYCFMADEAVNCVLQGKIAYTLKYYLTFLEKVQEKASKLSEKDENIWTPHDVECALWSSWLTSKHGISLSEDISIEKSENVEDEGEIEAPKKKRKT